MFLPSQKDGTGYRECLKKLWNLRNPGKSAVTVNTLCCHAHNIQTVCMLPDHELRRIECFCASGSAPPIEYELLSGGSCEAVGAASVEKPLVESSIVFSGDSAILNILSDKFIS